MSDNKLKHLEFIQGVISRLAGNSFAIKGWSVTLVAALLAVGSIKPEPSFFLLAYIPVVVFWGLDGYFLWQERIFRHLYRHVCGKAENKVDFSMDTSQFSSKENWPGSTFSITLWPFYSALAVSILLVVYLGG